MQAVMQGNSYKNRQIGDASHILMYQYNDHKKITGHLPDIWERKKKWGKCQGDNNPSPSQNHLKQTLIKHLAFVLITPLNIQENYKLHWRS